MPQDNEVLSREEILEEFLAWRRVFEDILIDIERSASCHLLYNIDFSYLFDFLWNEPPVGIPAWVPGGRRLFAQLLDDSDEIHDFSLVFTGPSYFELLDSIKHKIHEVDGFIFGSDSTHARLSRELDKSRVMDDVDAVFVRSGVSRTILNYIKNVGTGHEIDSSLARIRRVFGDARLLQGVGDHIDSAVFSQHKARFRESYREVLDEMMRRRPEGLRRRSKKDKLFHFGVDSSNIVATIQTNSLAQDVRMLFVTQGSLRRHYCIEEGRSPYVPLFRITARRLQREGQIGEPCDYFKDLLQIVVAILRDLEKTRELTELPQSTAKSIIDFVQLHMRRLGSPEEMVSGGHAYSVEELRRIFKDTGEVEASFEDSRDQLESIGKFLVTRQRHLVEKDPLVAIMETDAESPVMKGIRQAFAADMEDTGE